MTTEDLHLLSLPQLVLEIVLQDFSVESMRDVAPLAVVCKRFLQLLTKDRSANAMWKRLATARWVFVEVAEPVESWLIYSQRRAVALAESPSGVGVANCLQWQFKCPISLEKLSRTADAKVDFCSECKEHVYLCETIEDLGKHVALSHCVAYVPPETKQKLPRFQIRRRLMGMMRR